MDNTERKTVVIERSRWASADRLKAWNLDNDEALDAALLIPDNGMMCCLGFVCKSLGFADEDLKSQGMPNEIADPDDLPGWLINVEDDAACLNDKKTIDDDTREERLKELFRLKTPIDLEFVP